MLCPPLSCPVLQVQGTYDQFAQRSWRWSPTTTKEMLSLGIIHPQRSVSRILFTSQINIAVRINGRLPQIPKTIWKGTKTWFFFLFLIISVFDSLPSVSWLWEFLFLLLSPIVLSWGQRNSLLRLYFPEAPTLELVTISTISYFLAPKNHRRIRYLVSTGLSFKTYCIRWKFKLLVSSSPSESNGFHHFSTF